MNDPLLSKTAIGAGALEILMAIAVLVFWRQRWPLLVTALAMIGLLLAVVVVQPVLLVGAFNPVTTNLSVLALSVVALQLHSMHETAV